MASKKYLYIGNQIDAIIEHNDGCFFLAKNVPLIIFVCVINDGIKDSYKKNKCYSQALVSILFRRVFPLTKNRRKSLVFSGFVPVL